MNKKILIAAHPRSGTGFISQLLTGCGIDIPHEVRLGVNGISSWRGIIDYIDDCDVIIHQIRNPIKVIASSTIIMPDSWRYMYKQLNLEMPKLLIERAMFSYYYWNLLIESKKPLFRYKIEDVFDESILKKIFGLFGADVPGVLPNVPLDFNTKHKSRKKYVDYNIMNMTNNKMATLLYKMSQRYDYLIK